MALDLLRFATSLLALASPATPATSPPDGVWPLAPRPAVVRAFDPPDSPFGAGHRGVDLGGRAGQWVHAAMAGRVAFSGVIAGRGVVVVDHGATRTTYEPVAGVLPTGTAVQAGGVVGRLELAGSHCAPSACLHWGWIRGSVYLDPLLLVGAVGPVRLWSWESAPAAVGSAPTPSTRPWAGWQTQAERWLRRAGGPVDRPGGADRW